MESHRRPIRELAEALRAFVGIPRAQLFHVTTDAALHDSVAEVAMSFEHHADNVSPFVRLDEAYSADGAGWDRCAATLRADHAKRREGRRSRRRCRQRRRAGRPPRRRPVRAGRGRSRRRPEFAPARRR